MKKPSCPNENFLKNDRKFLSQRDYILNTLPNKMNKETTIHTKGSPRTLYKFCICPVARDIKVKTLCKLKHIETEVQL